LAALLIGTSMQLCFTPQELVAMFREKVAEFQYSGILPKVGTWSKQEQKEHFKEFSRFAEMVKKHNDDPDTKWVGVLNEFSLMTETERKSYLGANDSMAMSETKGRDIRLEKRSVLEDPPEEKEFVDWSHKLPPAKDQGGCGSCWVFSGLASLEYQLNREQEDEVISLSTKWSTDCTYPGGACNGGWSSDIWSWAQEHDHKLLREDDYKKYNAKTEECNLDEPAESAMGDYRIIGWVYIKPITEELEKALANPKYGVMSTVIGVSGGFYSYGSGVYYEAECPLRGHLVNLVGYGVLNGEQYWNVRNSWGPWWGDNGYIKMKRGHDMNMCGILTNSFLPLLVKGDQTSAKYYQNETGKECRDQSDAKGLFYRGTVSQTKSGLKCQKWTSQTPNDHKQMDNYNMGLGDHNYCRNPDGEGKPWCYNDEGSKPRWELCDIPVCNECEWEEEEGTQGLEKSDAMKLCEKDENCLGVSCDGDHFCWLYNGPENKDIFIFGTFIKEADCSDTYAEDLQVEKRDADNEPQDVSCNWKISDQGTNIFSLEDAKTECEMMADCEGITCDTQSECWLNMKNGDSIKKYTVYVKDCSHKDEDQDDPSKFYDNKLGKECREPEDEKGSGYRGTVSQTKSGLTCQKWTSQTPISHDRTPNNYQSEGLGDHNYCRNPDGEGQPWCYNVADSWPRWEYCDIPVCPECDWEETVVGTVTHRRGGAKIDCLEDKDCQGFKCKGDEDCWLMYGPDDISKTMTVYTIKNEKLEKKEKKTRKTGKTRKNKKN